MYYYDPNDRQPRRWAAIAAGAYALVLAVSFAVVSFDFSPALEKPGDTILVDFTEPPAPAAIAAHLRGCRSFGS